MIFEPIVTDMKASQKNYYMIEESSWSNSIYMNMLQHLYHVLVHVSSSLNWTTEQNWHKKRYFWLQVKK